MGNDSMASNLVANRGNRCTATILSFLETNVYNQYDIPKGLQRQIRQAVLDSINGYKDLVIDIVKSDDAVMNDLYLDAIVQIRDEISSLRRSVDDLLEDDYDGSVTGNHP